MASKGRDNGRSRDEYRVTSSQPRPRAYMNSSYISRLTTDGSVLRYLLTNPAFPSAAFTRLYSRELTNRMLGNGEEPTSTTEDDESLMEQVRMERTMMNEQRQFLMDRHRMLVSLRRKNFNTFQRILFKYGNEDYDELVKLVEAVVEYFVVHLYVMRVHYLKFIEENAHIRCTDIFGLVGAALLVKFKATGKPRVASQVYEKCFMNSTDNKMWMQKILRFYCNANRKKDIIKFYKTYRNTDGYNCYHHTKEVQRILEFASNDAESNFVSHSDSNFEF